MENLKDLLLPLDDLAYLIECAALDYTGELKTELSRLCEEVRSGAIGYEAQIVQASLVELDASLVDYRKGETARGTCGLIRVSRKWWAAAKNHAAA